MQTVLIRLIIGIVMALVIWMVVDIVKSANLKDVVKKAYPQEKACRLILFLNSIPGYHDSYNTKIFAGAGEFRLNKSTIPNHYYYDAIQGSNLYVDSTALKFSEYINVPNQATFDITHLIQGVTNARR